MSQEPVNLGLIGTTGHPNGRQICSLPQCGGQEEKERKNKGMMVQPMT